MHNSPVLKVLGLNIDLSTFSMIIISCIIVFVLARLSVRNLSVTEPSKMQNFMEWVVEFVQGIVAGAMDLKHGKPFIALGMTLIMFIFVSNIIGLPFAIITEHHQELIMFGQAVVSQEMINEAGGQGAHVLWWKSPTADLAVTFGLAIVVFFLTHYLGITRNGRRYFKHYFEPFTVFLPLNIIKEVSKPVTLGIRLFANIFAGEILIGTIIMAGAFGIPLMIAWQGFSLFIGGIQAFLFTILTMVYISSAAIHVEES